MKSLKCNLVGTCLAIASMMLIHAIEVNAQSDTERRAASLSKAQRTQIIDSILSGDLERVKDLAGANPQHAPGIAALYAKHSGARGKEAGKVAAEIALAIDADVDEASDIVAAVSQKTTASLEEVSEIISAIVESGLPIF